MSSTISKRPQLWVCWQEPEMDRGKLSLIPSSWVAKSLTGDGSPGSLVLCRWPRSEELFTAKVVHDPTPNDLAQVEVMEVPMFVEEQGENGNESNGAPTRKAMVRKDRPTPNQAKLLGPGTGGSEDATFVVSQLKRFFLGEMSKITGEMQANFDILGHRIGALEVNMKCVRERVERIENILNTAVHDFEAPNDRTTTTSFLSLQSQASDDDNDAMMGLGRAKVKSDVPLQTTAQSKRSQDGVSTVTMAGKRMTNSSMDQEEEEVNEDDNDGQDSKPVVIPRAPEQRVRKDRNPRPRAVVVTCPRNRNMVLLGGDERFRMPLPTYLDAIRHAKRPTATYMVTALLRRYLPPGTLSRLCVNERQLANTSGGTMVDQELLEALKKQGRMQFPHTTVIDRELMLRIEDVTRDVRRKIKLKKAMASSVSKRSGGGSSGTPISMVAPQRVGGMGVGSSRRSKAFSSETLNDDSDGRVLRLRDAEGALGMADGDDDQYEENPEALPMFS